MSQTPNPSQVDQIYAFLKKGNSITPDEARNLCGCSRLGARIKDLRNLGIAIEKKMIKVRTRFGSTHVAQYRLAN